jgi:nucleoid DNA-binding protein
MAEVKIISIISKLGPKVERGHTIELDTLADEIAEQSGFDRGDARDFAFKFSQALIRHLKLGDYVKLGEIGSFSVSCDNTKELKVNYRASNAIKAELERDFRGDFVNGNNAGLNDEGYAALWLLSNPDDTVVMRDGSTRTP